MSRFTALIVEGAALMWRVIGLEQSFRTTRTPSTAVEDETDFSSRRFRWSGCLR